MKLALVTTYELAAFFGVAHFQQIRGFAYLSGLPAEIRKKNVNISSFFLSLPFKVNYLYYHLESTLELCIPEIKNTNIFPSFGSRPKQDIHGKIRAVENCPKKELRLVCLRLRIGPFPMPLAP